MIVIVDNVLPTDKGEWSVVVVDMLINQLVNNEEIDKGEKLYII